MPDTNNHIPQEAFDWYDEYAHGGMDRRTFMAKLGGLVALGYSMTVLTSALLPNYALAEQVSFNDSDILASYEKFSSPDGHGEGQGYLVKPTTEKASYPVVLVIHENRGLNPYVKDVARRLAKAGFVAFAPDALYPLGGYPGNDDEGRALQRTLDRSKIQHDFVAAANYLKSHPLSNGKLGAVGFCFGGYMVNYLAAVDSKLLSAGVPFYGTPAAKTLRANIKAPLMIQLGELDARVNKSWPEYEQDLKAAGVEYQMHMYKNAKHGFHNDSTGRFDKESAELAWQRTLSFFNEKLS
ncbi:dienelactone hydrolase family protein [Thalassotalea sp. M1531]|uniref:Dienelactone hydrolase family protein n=1 Tax=Thalassotalea algicola TaxID=2716224 RepID=A0A7Y0LE38_9GAMM|nr:dienelactone hydrolase family protein [Thalassotalea algicola]NMP32587.1 dienelactone hydrolase family protein [Thalassotalea algicola]